MSAPDKTLARYCRRMSFNPGFIKWFVSAVQADARPEQILAHPDVFLDFCMANVYRHLSSDAKDVLTCLQMFPNDNSLAELNYYLSNDVGVDRILEAIQDLLRTNMVRMSSRPVSASYETKYSLSELARKYLNTHHPVERLRAGELQRRRRKLVSDQEDMAARQAGRSYAFKNISIRSRSDVAIARMLADAMRLAGQNDLAGAEQLIQEAKQLAPEYSEVHRVAAFVHVVDRSYLIAREDYQAALELAPDSPQLHFWYGTFLMRYLDDTEGALVELTEANRLDSNVPRIQLEMTRAFLYLHDYTSAQEILDELMGRDDLIRQEQVRLWDFRIQFHARKADDLADCHDNQAALKHLEAMQQEFCACPNEFLDNRMREKLEKTRPTACRCFDYLSDRNDKERASEILEWINKETFGYISF